MPKAPRSKLEQQLDSSLEKLYPTEQILHDYPIKVRSSTLYVDRVITARKLAFEVDGSQHEAYSAFFHKTTEGFTSHKERDKMKEDWLDSHGYTLVRLSHKDKLTPKSIRQKILEALDE